MRRKSKSIFRRTAAELRGMPRRGSRDDAMEDIDWAQTELPEPRRKRSMTLRLDADMLDWFRAQGQGYQARINAILRRYYEQKAR